MIVRETVCYEVNMAISCPISLIMNTHCQWRHDMITLFLKQKTKYIQIFHSSTKQISCHRCGGFVKQQNSSSRLGISRFIPFNSNIYRYPHNSCLSRLVYTLAKKSYMKCLFSTINFSNMIISWFSQSVIIFCLCSSLDHAEL
jgi:hypothetical protein